MKKYIAIYNSPAEAIAGMANATPEQKAEGMKPWMTWNEKVGKKMVDLGSPLMPGSRVDPDGHWKPAGTQVSGYSIVQAESLEDAKKLFKDHPHISWHPGCSIDVAECAEM